MRFGRSTDEDVSLINSTGTSSGAMPRSHTALCLLRADVDELNNKELSMIPGREHRSHCIDKFEVNECVELQSVCVNWRLKP